MTGPQIAIVAVAVFLAVPIIMCHLLGRPEKLPAQPGFPAATPMRQRPRTPGATHWGIDPTPADLGAIREAASEITRAAALARTSNPKAQATCPSSQAATAQENT